LLHRQADRAAQQAKADDGDAFEAHLAASAISRSASAMASICSAGADGDAQAVRQALVGQPARDVAACISPS
jgi:hypothetical protein